MELSPSWEANRSAISQELPRILWNPKVHYRIHKCPHLSLSWASSILSITPHPTSWWSILILFSHLRLVLPSGLFPSGFPPKISVHASPLLHTCFMPRPYNCTWFYHPHFTGWGFQTISSTLCSFLHSLLISLLLGPNILLNTLFSNTLSPCSFLSILTGLASAGTWTPLREYCVWWSQETLMSSDRIIWFINPITIFKYIYIYLI